MFSEFRTVRWMLCPTSDVDIAMQRRGKQGPRGGEGARSSPLKAVGRGGGVGKGAYLTGQSKEASLNTLMMTPTGSAKLRSGPEDFFQKPFPP